GHLGLARGYALGLKAVNVVLLFISLVLVLFADPIIHLLYGDAFARSVRPLQLLAFMALLYGLNSFSAAALIARDKPGAFAKLIAPLIVLNIGLNFILIPKYGADGAAFDALLSSAILAAASLWQARKVTGEVDFVGAFAGPFVAGLAMTAVVLAVHFFWIA